jgi:hypothetical protein
MVSSSAFGKGNKIRIGFIEGLFITFIGMKRVLLSLLLIFVLSGCKQSAIKKNFSTADSLVIYFKNEQAGEITKTVQTADAKAIGRMIEFIDGKGSEVIKCRKWILKTKTKPAIIFRFYLMENW